MGIKSGPFSGVVLSGKDIQKFERQIQRHVPNKKALATVARGEKLMGEFLKKGYVSFTAKAKAAR